MSILSRKIMIIKSLNGTVKPVCTNPKPAFWGASSRFSDLKTGFFTNPKLDFFIQSQSRVFPILELNKTIFPVPNRFLRIQKPVSFWTCVWSVSDPKLACEQVDVREHKPARRAISVVYKVLPKKNRQRLCLAKTRT